MRRVLVDQGRVVEVIYLDLYKELNLKLQDLTAYDSPLVSFEGKTVTPKGPDQTAHTNGYKRGGGGFHYSLRLFTLHSHCS